MYILSQYGPNLSPKALAIAHDQVPVDGAIPRVLFVCTGHNQGLCQVPVEGAVASALAMARALSLALALALALATVLRPRPYQPAAAG